jgi:hypothetical protein
VNVDNVRRDSEKQIERLMFRVFASIPAPWPLLMPPALRYIGEDEVFWIDTARVRMPPPPMTQREMEQFFPRVGESVEVAFSEDGELESWWEGRVDKVKGDFYVISFPDGEGALSNEARTPNNPFS